jgi:hypothetical protein
VPLVLRIIGCHAPFGFILWLQNIKTKASCKYAKMMWQFPSGYFQIASHIVEAFFVNKIASLMIKPHSVCDNIAIHNFFER